MKVFELFEGKVIKVDFAKSAADKKMAADQKKAAELIAKHAPLIKKALETPDPKLKGPVLKFEKWYRKHDLWHQGFATAFTDCVSHFFPNVDEYIIEQIGIYFSDHCTSFYGDKMEKFIEYAKKHPIPNDENGEYDAYDDHGEIAKYCEAALEGIAQLFRDEDKKK